MFQEGDTVIYNLRKNDVCIIQENGISVADCAFYLRIYRKLSFIYMDCLNAMFF